MRASWSFLTAFALVACGTSHTFEPVDAGPTVELPAAGRTAAMLLGSEGGTLALGDLVLDVPAGAVRSETEIRVTVEAAAAPAPFTGFSPVFRFEPAGLVFERPITVYLPFHGNAETATVFWTTLDSGAYAPLSTQIEGGLAIVESRHFSSAFVGTACSGDDCCGQANGDLDVLLMVDNSGSMAEEQASLAAQIPRLARVLATGDLDDDGVQDFPALQTLRMGAISSDMGGGFGIAGCESEFGDDGILLSGEPACAVSYPTSFAELDSSDPSADVDAFVDHVACVATTGTRGCGFEQQLEAVLKALTPSISPLRFHDDTTGHGDGANASFVRSGSLLATILLTDEEDCSAADRSLFNPDDRRYGDTLNLRCFENPEVLHPVSRFANGLKGLRANPNDVIFAAIAGVPVDLVSDPSAIDYTDLLSDPRMVEAVDPTNPNQLTPSCEVPGHGVAFPPRRVVQVAESFGANGVVQSICQEDFTPVVDAILQRVAARVSGSCGG